MNRITLLLLCFISTFSLLSQFGTIKGKVTNSINKEPIGFVTIAVEGTTTGGTSDDNGNYTITGLEPGIYNLKVNFIGYKPLPKGKVQGTWRLADLGFIILESRTLDIVLSNLCN